MNDFSIDPHTGQLTLKSRGWEFGPDMTLKNFLLSEAANSAKKISKLSHHYQVRIRLENGSQCTFILKFFGDILAEVLFGFWERELSWADWSLEGENVRKKAHDDFLLAQIGAPPYVFPWGRIRSVLDPRNQEAYIKVEYSRGP